MTYIPYKLIQQMDGETIDLLNITTRNKKHQHCELIIKSSKNNIHRGLYCCNHKKWLQWITNEQESNLIDMGIKAETRTYLDLFWE